MTRVRIVSEGTSRTTRVLLDGKPLPNVSRVVVHPIEVDGMVRASIDLVCVALDLEADADVELRALDHASHT